MKTKSKIIVDKEALFGILKDKGLTIYELANLMKVAPSTVYRSIDDSNPKGVGGKTIASMLNALDLTESDFSRIFIFTHPLPKCNGYESTEEVS